MGKVLIQLGVGILGVVIVFFVASQLSPMFYGTLKTGGFVWLIIACMIMVIGIKLNNKRKRELEAMR